MFLLRYPLEFMGLYETIWTLFGIKVEGIAIFGNGPNRADQATNRAYQLKPETQQTPITEAK